MALVMQSLMFAALSMVSSANADITTVHIIAHSHEDPGWTLTTDECESVCVDV